MPLDPERLLKLPPIEVRTTIARRDTILYALGIGADELPFVYEERLKALPTMAVILGYPGFIWRNPAYGVDWKNLLHGESRLELHASLPVEGEVTGTTILGPIFDKGADKGAVLYLRREVYGPHGDHLATLGASLFLRGDGGFGGTSEGQVPPHPVPDKDPDLSYEIITTANQALIYRLSGDLNPLHVDPVVAGSAGFPRPILHGLCTYGVVGRAVLAALCGNDPGRLKRLDARFSRPVYPGETIRTDIWRETDGRAAFRATVVGRETMVLNNGLVEYV